MTASLGRLWAIARMTLIEASRRKVFVILLLFAAALLSSVAFFPSVEKMADRLRLMEVWALRATSLFTAIIALFLSGFSLPSDFEQKRIYMLVSKPVSKPAIFLGKLVGLSLLLAIFVGLMGLGTVLFIRGVQLFAGPAFPPLVAYERSEAPQFSAIRGREVDEEAGRIGVLAREQGALLWRFTGLRRSDFGDRLRLESRLSVGAEKDDYRASGTVLLEARNPSGRKHRMDQFLNTNEEKEWWVPADLVGPDGTLDVAVRCGDTDGFLIASKPSMAVYFKSSFFEAAFARGMVLLFLQSMTVLALTLMASAILSAPLSILLGILLYMVGSAHSYVKDGARDIDRSLSELKTGEKRPRMAEEIPPWFLRYSSAVSKAVLKAVPDFDDFDFSRWLLKDRAVSWGDLGNATRLALLPVLVLGAVGMLVMRFKDFDR
ncbi:MAG TPA: hypothetical protein VJB14_09720 [Planctomycetota bacterium]|nr:hypothetical protein [Planctomycetota bacterium]